jgi:hypothetical protein
MDNRGKMTDIEDFSNQLSELIETNHFLKDRLKQTEEWLKLAICVHGSLNFRNIHKVDVDLKVYTDFIENTQIVNYGNAFGGLKLVIVEKEPSPMIPDKYCSVGREVTMDDIMKIFGNK